MTVAQRHMFLRLLLHAGAAGVVTCLIILLIMTQPLFYLLAEHVISLRVFLLACAMLAADPIYRGLPFGICVAIVHDYMRWGRDNEIVSLRMAGMSNHALAMPGIAAATVVAVLAAVVSLYLSPLASAALEDIRYRAGFDLSLRLLDEGYLQRIVPDLSVSFRKRIGPSEIADVTIIDSRQTGEIKYIMADRAELHTPADSSVERVLVLREGNYQVRRDSGERPAPVTFQELILPITESATASSRVREWRGPFEQHIGVLLNPPPEIPRDSRTYGSYIALGHLHIIAPLSCLGCAIFALGVMLTARYERRVAPIFSAVGASVGIAISQALLIAAYFTVYHMPSLAALYYAVVIAPAAIGASLLRSRALTPRPGSRHLPGLPSPASTSKA
jgi:lipopolysaccharide export LptBFGC system permease protein LptF